MLEGSFRSNIGARRGWSLPSGMSTSARNRPTLGPEVEVGWLRISRRQRFLRGLLGLAVLVAVVLLNEVAFRTWLDTDYPRWYLNNGAAIGFVFTLVTLAWGDINGVRHLISANPLAYAAASLEIASVPFTSLAAMIRPDRSEWKAQRNFEQAHRQFEQSLREQGPALEQLAARTTNEDLRRRITELLAPDPGSDPVASEDTPAESQVPTAMPVLDVVVAMLFALTFSLATLAWLVLVVPLQYFVYLVTGAPARVACASPSRAWVKSEEKPSGGRSPSSARH